MKFSEIAGQDSVKKRLRESVLTNRVSHAQLFFGPPGSGKLAMAIAYAQYINCKNRTSEDSCGICSSCKKYNLLMHPDLHFIFPINNTKEVDERKIYSKDFYVPWRDFLTKNQYYVTLPAWYELIGIEKKQGIINADEADGINRTLVYKSYEAEYKVMIIWMVEKMNIVSANKLLKNLEEPAEKSLFILISEDKEEIISTILSRTQLIKFSALSDKEVAENIALQKDCNNDLANRIAHLSSGNYTLALSLYDKLLNQTDEVDFETSRFILFRDWMRQCYTVARNLSGYENLMGTNAAIVGDGSREKLKEFLIYAMSMFQICHHYHIGNHGMARYEGEILEFVKAFSKFIHPYNIEYFEREMNKAIFHIERNANPIIIITDLSLLISQILRIPIAPQAKKL